MYNYIESVGITSNFDGTYYPINIINTSLFNIFNTYTGVFVTLSRPGDGKEVILNLYDLPTSLRNLQMTLQQWLSANGDVTLPTIDAIPDFDYKYVRARDVWQVGFDVQPYNKFYHPDTELTSDMEKDILLKHDTANYANIRDYALFTVNGLIYKSGYSEHGIAVLNCVGDSLVKNKKNIGYLDFQDIGKLDIIPITDSMIHSRPSTRAYKEAVYIDLPEEIGNRVPLLVIGGFLHALDDLYSVVSDTTIKFDFLNYPWINRYHTAQQYKDLSFLEVENLNNGAGYLEELFSDEVIGKWMTCEESFIVMVNTESLKRGSIALESTNLEGKFTTSITPIYPLSIGDGRIPEYVITTEDSKYVISASDTLLSNWVYETGDYLAQEVVLPLRESVNPYRNGYGQFIALTSIITKE